MAFKLHTEWSNTQCGSTHTTIILPTTMATIYDLNSFDHVIYALQITTYQNITKLLTLYQNTISKINYPDHNWKARKIVQIFDLRREERFVSEKSGTQTCLIFNQVTFFLCFYTCSVHVCYTASWHFNSK